MARLSYLGPQGTFSEEAALLYAVAGDWQLAPYPSIVAAIAAAESGEVEAAMVPLENSLEGSVNATLDALIFDSQLKIRSELVLPVVHNLLGQRGVEVTEARLLYSHPQALGQCRSYIESNLPGIELVAALSTARAVEQMLADTTPALAIGTRRAQQLYGANMLAESIQDGSHNVTRFVVLAGADSEPTGDDLTSLAFTVPGEERPGTLHQVLQEFAAREINLTRIESRPGKKMLGRYVFLVDMEGHRRDSKLVDALAAIEPNTTMVKVFGSYPRDRRPLGG